MDDKCRAIQCLPFPLRQMWVHAYQSYLFNVTASARIQQHGLRVLVGDLVVTHSATDIDIWDKISDDNIRRISSEEEAHTASISDVVLPLPGYGVQFPDNSTGAAMREMLQREGITLSEVCCLLSMLLTLLSPDMTVGCLCSSVSQRYQSVGCGDVTAGLLLCRVIYSQHGSEVMVNQSKAPAYQVTLASVFHFNFLLEHMQLFYCVKYLELNISSDSCIGSVTFLTVYTVMGQRKR